MRVNKKRGQWMTECTMLDQRGEPSTSTSADVVIVFSKTSPQDIISRDPGHPCLPSVDHKFSGYTRI